MIKYIGSKRLLLPRILQVVRAVPDVHTVVDLFAGTSRVGHALKGAGYRVLANDHNAYATTLARCYVQADAEDVLGPAQALLPTLSALAGEPATSPRPGANGLVSCTRRTAPASRRSAMQSPRARCRPNSRRCC